MRSGLIVAGKRIPQARLKFPPELVNNLEVSNRSELISLCQTFFEEHDFHNKRVLVVLDGSIIFRKNIKLDQAGEPNALSEAFVAAMPLEEGRRACIAIKSDNLLQLIATNSDLYTLIAEALHGCGIAKLVAITPAAAYDLSGVNKEFASMVAFFFKGTPASKMADFNNVKPL